MSFPKWVKHFIAHVPQVLAHRAILIIFYPIREPVFDFLLCVSPFHFVHFLSTSVFYHTPGLLSSPKVEKIQKISIHQQARAVHQKIIDVTIRIFAIFDDPQNCNREAEPRGSETEGDNQEQVDNHSQCAQVVGFVLVTMLDIEEFSKHIRSSPS